MTFFNKFVENVNEFGCLWKEFEEFLEMDDEFEHVEFIQQYGTFEFFFFAPRAVRPNSPVADEQKT